MVKRRLKQSYLLQTCMEVTTKAIQVLGENGYTKSILWSVTLGMLRFVRLRGDSEVQRLVIAAAELKAIE